MSKSSLVVDRTHLGRRASGIERITEELFSDDALRTLPVEGFAATGQGRLTIAAAQMARAPLAMMRRPATLWAFSGFPPSPLALLFRERAVMYVHDMFLITRRQDLNRAAKVYMGLPFRLAVERLRYFLVNSETTARNLAPYVSSDAEIRPYRPQVRNVFGLGPEGPPKPPGAPLVLGAIGTVEPRKGLPAAAAIAGELGRRLGRPVELHVVGRKGWGEDHRILAREPHVTLHGFLPEAEASRVIGGFDALISTAHDEGLGLPLIEAQYGGLQAIAPDRPVFREVLGTSGLFIDPSDVAGSAALLASRFGAPGWRMGARAAAAGNIARWNAQARADRAGVLAFLSDRLARLAAAPMSGLEVLLGFDPAQPQAQGRAAQDVAELEDDEGRDGLQRCGGDAAPLQHQHRETGDEDEGSEAEHDGPAEGRGAGKPDERQRYEIDHAPDLPPRLR